MKKTLRSATDLLEHGLIEDVELQAIEKVDTLFSIAISDSMLEQMDKTDGEDPIRQQFVPSAKELKISMEELADPIGDQTHSPLTGIVHRYPDRCLLMAVQVCPVYCRFCFRRQKVGAGNKALSDDELHKALDYIKNTTDIFEVILTGGDPLILSPSTLKVIIDSLNIIEHVNVVRIHSRIPLVDPERITDELLEVLASSEKIIYLAVHANHANEFSDEGRRALKKLRKSGVVLVSQTVLLNGVNDTLEDLVQLMKNFVINGVKPYYLHHGDLAQGTSHFRVSLEKGQQLMEKMRGRYSGLMQPTYIFDIPGGYGKVPVNESYIQSEGGEHWVKDINGKRHLYRDSALNAGVQGTD